MKLTDISVNRSVTSIMLFFALIVLGFVSYSKMPLDLFPDIEFPIAVIITDYPDAGPKEIESMVTRPIEEMVAGINNVETISSVSQEGLSMVRIEFTWGTDMAMGVSDIRERIDIVKKFLPEDVENPVVLKFDVSMMPIMVLAVSGDKDIATLRDYAENDLKNLMEQVDGVARANVRGGFKNEVRVELNRNRMEAYSLSIDEVIQILRMENLNVAGGEVKSPLRKFTLRTQGEFKTLKDIQNVVVTVKGNSPIYMRDIARIYERPAESKEIVRLNGDNGVVLAINKQSDKNTVIVDRDILKKLEDIKDTIPKGIKVSPFFNAAEHIENSIMNVVNNAMIGGLIAVLVVFIFLGNLRAALILGLSIPISIITTFNMMYYFDISLNILSMGGLALGVGMLIDNSIVILENIFRFREKGARPVEAAKLGADEMAMAITASTLTTISVFVPFLFTEGLAGQLFRDMALTITFSLLCSLLVALTLIPMMTSKFVTNIHNEYSGRFSFINKILSWSDNKIAALIVFYEKSIKWALIHRWRVVGFTVGAIIFGLLLLPIAGMEFMPEQDQGEIKFVAELPVGTNLETTEDIMKLIEKRVLKVIKKEEYVGIYVRGGYGEGFSAAFGDTKEHTGKVEIRLVSISKRTRSATEIRKALREAMVGVPGVKFNFNPQDGGGIGLGGAQITVEAFGYDFEQSKKYTEEIKELIKDIPGIKDISISREEGLPEKIIVVDREKASKLGLSAYSIANHIKNNVAGKVATTYRKSGKELDVMVRLREEDRQSIDDIKHLMIKSPMGKLIPLGNVIDIKTSSGPVSIERKKQERVSYINLKAEGRDLYSVVADIQDKVDTLVKPTNFRVEYTGAFKDMKESFQDLALALLLAVLLIYIIMASQFESLWEPLIIMFTIPTLIFGVMLFLFLTGTTFNVVSFMGVLMLSGIVVNNAIVFVDYTNILRARGLELHDAMVEAGKTRLRPILMTTFTTILALIPMALGIGEGAELTTPLARSVIGGLSSSFIFTLIFLPVVYSLLESLKGRFKNRSGKTAGGI